MNLSNSFAGGFISENGFYITYMLMTSLLLTSFSMAYSITLAALDKVLVAVRLLVPAFLLVLQFIGHATTAGGTYNLVLVGIWLIQAVIIRHLSDSDHQAFLADVYGADHNRADSADGR